MIDVLFFFRTYLVFVGVFANELVRRDGEYALRQTNSAETASRREYRRLVCPARSQIIDVIRECATKSRMWVINGAMGVWMMD